MSENKETPLNNMESDTAKTDEEPKFVTTNKGKFEIFRKFGLFLVYPKNGIYEASNKMLLLYYLLTYFGAAAIGGLAWGVKEIFKDETYADRIDDLIEAAFVGIFLGISPSCWIYLLREYSTHLPLILNSAKKLEKTEMYKKLDYAKKPKVSYREGFRDVDNNDALDEVFSETQKNVKDQWWIVKHGPIVGMMLSIMTCSILVIISLFWDVSDLIIQTPSDSIQHLKKDLPHFIMSVLYPVPCFVSLWYCILFLEWQRKIYSSLRNEIRTIMHKNMDTKEAICKPLNEDYKKEFEKICHMVTKLQRVFILLNKKIFQKTLVLSFSLFIFLGVFISYKIIQNHTNLFYFFPLSLIGGHLYLICKWSNDLMAEFNEIIDVLNEFHEDDVADLRRELHEMPPQVCAFGGFSADYSMMTAVIAFMLSIISITGMIWPEIQNGQEDLYCYEHSDSIGEWNTTLCVKRNCYNYHDENGIKTLCIKDKINESLFSNGTLSLTMP